MVVRAAKFILSNRTAIISNKGEKINEEDACKLLGISRKTLGNYIGLAKITPDMYTVGVGGNYFFYKEMLMNVKTKANG